MLDDNYFMNEALKEAKKAAEENEIPIGAVIVYNNQIIARAHNQTEALNDVTAHAEILAITAASNAIGAKYLDDCTLYVTVEPCPMCAGALYWSQIGKIVFGASDSKRGYRTVSEKMFHKKTKLFYGIKEEECILLMKEFFRSKR